MALRRNKKLDFINLMQCVKSVCIRTYSGPHIPTFGLNTERLVQFFINRTLRNFPFFL